MIENDERAREVARQPYRLVEIPPGCLQVEMQSMTLQQGISAKPFVVGHQRALLSNGVGDLRSTRLVTNATHQGKSSLPREYRSRIAPVQTGLVNNGIRQPKTICQTRSVTIFVSRIFR